MRKKPQPKWLRTKKPSYQRLWGECVLCKRLLWKPALKRGHYKKDGCSHLVLPHPLPPPLRKP
jgi:hypothetical protein